MTATPRSTPLPDVPEVPPLGDDQRPIALVFVLPEPDSDAREVKDDLETRFNRDDLAVDIQFVDDELEALKVVCNGTSQGYPAAVWASAFTLIAAERQCDALPGLAITRGRAPRLTVGTTGELVARVNINSISALAGQPFCRIDAQDFTSWILPGLLLAAEGIDPLTGLSQIRDYPDNLSMLRAIYHGDCVAASLPPGEFEDLLDELTNQLNAEGQPITLSGLQELIKVISPAGDTSMPSNTATWEGYPGGVVPYEGLIFPSNAVIAAPLREQMIEVIADFADSSTGRALLTDILDAASLIETDTGSYANFRTLMERARWAMIFVG